MPFCGCAWIAKVIGMLIGIEFAMDVDWFTRMGALPKIMLGGRLEGALEMCVGVCGAWIGAGAMGALRLLSGRVTLGIGVCVPGGTGVAAFASFFCICFCAGGGPLPRSSPEFT